MYAENILNLGSNGIQELSIDQLDQIGGGFLPLFFLAACCATYCEVKFLEGVFDGAAGY